MFWESFAKRRKGPSFIWEREYGGIDATNLLRSWFRLAGGCTEPPAIGWRKEAG
ncbi:hypothetical protein B0T26DRAFT_730392 [Lasiosphaeria miniovina]|uniref:Uncharacterized protein n=1 Tax=Lasiosphaeria miniovina TaxID=1954250 RepID=A0AA40DH24_9PEZI|nr:uncharacterized protein B0T26DRAFT_730392 [Lasiosphaeria miniovina]KAK0703234.1 hypothetical protein B0T26DRAFT_730392 [Lasiosphaeria miniovina]